MSLCTDRLCPRISPKDAAPRPDAPRGELAAGETRLWRILKAEASWGPGKPRAGSTRRPHAGEAAVPHRAEKLPRGRRRAGGREGRRREPLPSATPRPRVAPSPPSLPRWWRPVPQPPAGRTVPLQLVGGRQGESAGGSRFLLGKRVGIVPVLRPCRPPGAAGLAGTSAPPPSPFGGDMVLAEGSRTAGPEPPAVPRRSSHRTIECGAAAQSAPPPAPNHRVELRPAWISWRASGSTRPHFETVSLAANIQESHAISDCQEQAI